MNYSLKFSIAPLPLTYPMPLLCSQSEISGEVVKVLVENGQPVSPGQVGDPTLNYYLHNKNRNGS